MAFAETALGVGSLISGASSLWSAGSSGNMNRKNRKWQEKMYKRSLADQRENAQLQWQENRDYAKYSYDNFESPAAQRAGMAAAGINPFFQGSAIQSMGATQGSASAPEGGTLPSSGPYRFNPGSAIQPGMSAMMSGISQMQAIKASEANIELMNANTIKTLAEAKGVQNTNSLFDFMKAAAESDALSKRFKAKVSEVEAAFASANAIANLDERQAKIASLWAQHEKDLAQAAKTDADRLTVDALRDLQKRSLEAAVDLTEAQTKTEGAKQSNLDAQTDTENALREGRKSLTDAQAKEILSRIGLNDIERDQKAYDFFLRLVNSPNASTTWGLLSQIATFVKSRTNRDLSDYQRLALSEYLEKLWSNKKP